MKKCILLFLLFCAMLVNAQTPVAKYSISTGTGSTVDFTDQSTGSSLTYLWDFGNGMTSTLQSPPSITYSSAGNYLVKLTVSNASGSSTLLTTVSVSERPMIDLCTGRNDDGTLMPDSVPDPDWTYTNAGGVTGIPTTRYDASGWSYPQLITFPGPKRSKFITSNILVGLTTYVSKSFTIPADANAILSLETLAWDRQTTYLVKENADGSITETIISYSTSTPAYVTSRNTNFDGPISEGNYKIKVVVDNQRSAQRNSTSVAGLISLGLTANAGSIVEFTSNSTNACKDAAVQFNTTENSENSYNWTFTNGTNVITATGANPSVTFTKLGFYNAKLEVAHANGQISNLQIDNYMQITDCITTDYTRAPNSYIFTGKNESGNDVDGFYIPVKKAYAMWNNGAYMGGDALNSNQTATAVVYWEDVSGLIKTTASNTYNLEIIGTGENAKIKILVDKAKGKGNAVVAYKLNGEIKWSWHVWVTDDPTDGMVYEHGLETDKDGNDFEVKFMDRNLGALNNSFLGNDWHRVNGLHYQWGRKDPIPPFVNLDHSHYQVTGDAGIYRYQDSQYQLSNGPGSTPVNNIPIVLRGLNSEFSYTNTYLYTESNLIKDNIRYTVKNPLHYIIYDDNATWFSKKSLEIDYTDLGLPTDSNQPLIVKTWDLWSDNRKGYGSNNQSSNATIKNDSWSYEIKAPYDPCPNGWRVPSHYGTAGGGGAGAHNNQSPWGRHTNLNDDQNNRYDFPSTADVPYNAGVKVYPGLGFDFTNSERNIGFIPMSGNYEYKGPQIADPSNHNAQPIIFYQDEAADATIFTSSLAPFYNTGAFGIYAVAEEVSKTSSSTTGSNRFYVNMTHSTNQSGCVRCMKDPNLLFIDPDNSFDTEYITLSQSYDFETLNDWTKQPNSYVEYTSNPNNINDSQHDLQIQIPLAKGYAMHKLHLSENQSFPSGSIRTPKIEWTTNMDLIENIEIVGTTYENSKINITLKPNEIGNAVVSFRLGNNGVWGVSNPDPVIWSWHIWAPKDEIGTVTYTTKTISNGGAVDVVSNHFTEATTGVGPSLTTTFMDRNLGAEETFPLVPAGLGHSGVVNFLNGRKNWSGMHYQWGRKDPLPTFHKHADLVDYNYNINNVVVDSGYYDVFEQSGFISDSIISYSIVTEGDFITRSQSYTNYSSTLGINNNMKKYEKVQKVVKHSVQNPLVFLYHNRTGNEKTYEGAGELSVKVLGIKDWVSDEKGLFTERWGHATTKSPYDPCPEGWRVPDTHRAILSFNYSVGSINAATGSSPWYYARYDRQPFSFIQRGISQNTVAALNNQDQNNPINTNNYPGRTVRTSGSGTRNYGAIFEFPGSEFNIGRFPFAGFRGEYGGNDWNSTVNAGYYETNLPTYRFAGGFWLSSPSDVYSGYALGMKIEASRFDARMATATAFYPQAAMSCRCAKIEYDANGNEIGRYDPNAIAVPQDAQQKAGDTFTKKKIQKMVDDEKFSVYPNPVKDVLYIDVKDNKEYHFQIYNLTGNMVKEGRFTNNQTNISSLPSGVYLVRINNSGSVVRIIKN